MNTPSNIKTKEKWYRVEYYTTLKPPKSNLDRRYFPAGNGKPFKVDNLLIFKISK